MAVTSEEIKRVAVIGGGISGISTAHNILKIHDQLPRDQRGQIEVHLYEAGGKLGGHTSSVRVDGFGDVDYGFQVMNRETTMSFSVTWPPPFEGRNWASTPLSLLVNGLTNSRFRRMVRGMAKFHCAAWKWLEDLEKKMETETHTETESAGRTERAEERAVEEVRRRTSLSGFCAEHKIEQEFVDDYLRPFCMSVWSCAPTSMDATPAYTVLVFMRNHGLLQFDKLQWYTLKEGPSAYLDAWTRRWESDNRLRVHLNSPVRSVEGGGAQQAEGSSQEGRGGARLGKGGGGSWRLVPEEKGSDSGPSAGHLLFDHVIVATNCHQVAPILRPFLSPPDEPGRAASPQTANLTELNTLLNQLQSTHSDIIIHSDSSRMPPRKREWASWNAFMQLPPHKREGTDRNQQVRMSGGDWTHAPPVPTLTYWSNKLFSAPPGAPDVFVTLNDPDPKSIDASRVFLRTRLSHPVLDPSLVSRVRRQWRRAGLGENGLHLAGAWMGFGFHEDGFVSGLEAADRVMAPLSGRVFGPGVSISVSEFCAETEKGSEVKERELNACTSSSTVAAPAGGGGGEGGDGGASTPSISHSTGSPSRTSSLFSRLGGRERDRGQLVEVEVDRLTMADWRRQKRFGRLSPVLAPAGSVSWLDSLAVMALHQGLKILFASPHAQYGDELWIQWPTRLGTQRYAYPHVRSDGRSGLDSSLIHNSGVIRLRDVRRAAWLWLLEGDIGYALSYANGAWDSPDLLSCMVIIARRVVDSPGRRVRPPTGGPCGAAAREAETSASSVLARLTRLAVASGYTDFVYPERLARLLLASVISLASIPLLSVRAWRHRLREGTWEDQARRNVAAHYDLGNAMFSKFLDGPTMAYSCANFVSPLDGRVTDSLAIAQKNKLEALLQLIDPSPGDHILDVGCGWGGFALYAARQRGCMVTGVTLSEEQLSWAQQAVKDADMEDRVFFLFCDYRQIPFAKKGTSAGKFKGAGRKTLLEYALSYFPVLGGGLDRATGEGSLGEEGELYDHVISCEMIEAAGDSNLGTYFDCLARLCAPSGRVVLQAICMPDWRYDRYRRSSDVINALIFPGGLCPSLARIQKEAARKGMELTLLRNRSEDYYLTLRKWRDNFLLNDACSVAPSLYDEYFARMFGDVYFAYCAAGFLIDAILLYQLRFEFAGPRPVRVRGAGAAEAGAR
uniref:Amine oxidase domain-containing protein n=1 Tax=Chromera velia CCMP2878 TaxID=1169474 RepID=A0A0G4HIL1_9ALVE|eukprot:Cvel_6959.t1-p1 / transcript=Cvel_6959.t1 / gene=Cvel_6959 / organism=Chromera_velia_CCMP2878 / gene_product=Cyclopropane-fatty-acyl-phospholipid synthase, putative / transcript_product=Cyclopropane-fatty-acyl-phospholipid synthase, putative / location=Cvel_scaffold353:5303-14746(-) / protein_length=1181 / sequence_SO=supercontig / SO=protein_coding / is_pseudo=false